MVEKRKHEPQVLQKDAGRNNNFNTMAEEKLILQVEQIKENPVANLLVLVTIFQERSVLLRCTGPGNCRLDLLAEAVVEVVLAPPAW